MINLGKHTYNVLNDIDCYWEADLTVGNYTSIGSGLFIHVGLHPNIENPKVVSQYPFKEQFGYDYPECKRGGKVVVGSDVWISSHVSILDGVVVGDGAILAAKSVVTRDVPPYAFVAGNPARIKYFRFTPEQIEKLLTIKWWEWDDEKVEQAIPSMRDIDTFLSIYG